MKRWAVGAVVALVAARAPLLLEGLEPLLDAAGRLAVPRRTGEADRAQHWGGGERLASLAEPKLPGSRAQL